MSGLEGKGITVVHGDELAAFVAKRAADLHLAIPEVCLPGVLENLRALQDHARIVEAWLDVSSPTVEEARLP